MPREAPSVAPPGLMDEGPTVHVKHRHSGHVVHHHVDEFERLPETHLADHHEERHTAGRKGVPSTSERDAAYTQNRTSILKRPYG
jgi:hypothetical protein